MPATSKVMNSADLRDGIGTMIDENPGSDDVLVMWANGRSEYVNRKQLTHVKGGQDKK